MPGPFAYFVILAEMRTGSNALEERINDFAALTSYGEVFNPHFVGRAGDEDLMGVTRQARDADPLSLIGRLCEGTEGLAGFRLFSDHDPRVIEHVLADPACGKIVLTRNPLESYISLKIARGTGQWWLGDMRSARKGKARFDAAEFEEYLSLHRRHQARILRALQTTGQAAFRIRHEDLGDAQVIAGIPAFLGVGSETRGTTRKGKVQNPAPLSEKVSNYAGMAAALAARDPWETDAIPSFEPSRRAGVPSYVACTTSPLLYLPVPGTDSARVEGWMAALDGAAPDALARGFTQKTLRQWMQKAVSHRSFAVVAHPVERAHRVFSRRILGAGPESYPAIREALRTSYKLPLPDSPDDPAYDAAAHRAAFLAFLGFLKGNLGGQTSIRVDPAWASQSAILQGMGEVLAVDHILREPDLAAGLARLADEIGAVRADVPAPEPEAPHPLAAIYDAEIEAAARAAYRRDYMMFGFGDWA